MSTLSKTKKGIGLSRIYKGFPLCLSKRQHTKAHDICLQIELFRYKNGTIEILQSWEERNKDFLYSKAQLVELAQHKRFLMRVIINQFKFIVPIGYENPCFYEGGKFLKMLRKQKKILSIDDTLLQDDCQLAVKQVENITKKRIKNGENLIFTSESIINYLPEDLGRPVIFDTDLIRFFARDREKGLYLIEKKIGIRSLEF